MPLFHERLRVLSRRESAKKSKTIKKKLLSVVFASLLLISLSPIKLEAMKSDETSKDTDATLKVDFIMNTPVFSDLSQKTQRITPGESTVDRETRLQAEAKAKADALAKISRNTVTRERRVYTDPSNFDVIYIAAGNRFGVSPSLLKAIHTVETGASGSTDRSNPSGATGPMQFLPSTFRAHAVDGNGDGIKDVTNVEDAIFSAAKYLVDCGYPDMKKALWGYNPSTRYYNKVIKLAESFGL